MPGPELNIFSLQGEILEIHEQDESSTVKVICKPEWLLLNIKNVLGFKLKDKIRMEGEFKIREMYKIELEKSNDKNNK